MHGHGKRDVRSDKENVPRYRKRHQRVARNTHTIADWIRLRFTPYYPGFTVKVLKADGKEAGGKSLLWKLRLSYET
jgi:membrane glycosyltransferase